MLKHSLFISLSFEKYGKRNRQTEYRDYHRAYKLKKRESRSQKSEIQLL